MIKYSQSRPSSLSTRWFALGLFAVAAVLFARTAYPTITWWDSSSYSLAAATLGVASPPGSLILTLLGWPVAKVVSPMNVAHALNVLAGIMAAGTVALVFVCAINVLESARSQGPSTPFTLGAALGAVLFASTTTLWDYGVRFTPYGLSAFVTTILVLVMMLWWQRADASDAWRLLVLLSFLFGVDFSVHRTNALLIPGALAFVLIRKPSAVVSARTIVASFAALAAGLAIQLLIIPIAAHGGSPLNFANPNTLARLWDYVSLKQLGGGFLLGLFPRNSSFWTSQVADVASVLRDNFFSRSGAFGVLGYVPGIAAAVGAIGLVRMNARLGVALLTLVATQIVATILYFNIRSGYFRSFDRHYLPICVIIGIFGACGFGSVLDSMGRARQPIVGVVVAAILCIVPIAQVMSSYHRHDASRRFFAHDWATNALTPLPPNAVYFTVGDNDTFPMMYVQSVEGLRRDVAIINTSIAMLPEWRARRRAKDPSFPLSATITTDSIVYAPTYSRPIAYAVTGAAYLHWPRDSGRFEGLHWTLAPKPDRDADLALVRSRLLEKSNYRGYADRSVDIDATTPSLAVNYYFATSVLLEAERAKLGADQCRADRAELYRLIPPERISLAGDLRTKIEAACN